MALSLGVIILIAGAVLLAFLACLLVPFVLWVRRRDWSARKKKIVFSLSAAFLIFPVLTPVATTVPLAAPHILFILMAIFGGWILEIGEWYFKTGIFSLASFFVTASVLGLVSQIIFFEKRQS